MLENRDTLGFVQQIQQEHLIVRQIGSGRVVSGPSPPARHSLSIPAGSLLLSRAYPSFSFGCWSDSR